MFSTSQKYKKKPLEKNGYIINQEGLFLFNINFLSLHSSAIIHSFSKFLTLRIINLTLVCTQLHCVCQVWVSTYYQKYVNMTCTFFNEKQKKIIEQKTLNSSQTFLNLEKEIFSLFLSADNDASIIIQVKGIDLFKLLHNSHLFNYLMWINRFFLMFFSLSRDSSTRTKK